MWALIIDNLDVKYGVLLDSLSAVGTYITILTLVVQVEKSKHKIKLKFAIISVIIVAIIFGSISYLATQGRKEAEEAEIQSQIELQQKEMAKTYELANAYYNTGSYLEAIKEYNKLSSDFSDYITAMEQKQSAVNAYTNSIFEESEKYIQSNNYTLAIELLDTLKKEDLLSDNPTIIASIQSKINSIQKTYAEECCNLANEYWKNNDITASLNILEEAKMNSDNNELIESTLNNILQEYRNDILNRAANSFSESGYQDAISVLTEGLSVLPEDEEFLRAIDEYMQKRPIYLSNLEYYMSGGEGSFHFRDSSTDNFGNPHSDIIYILSGFSPTTSTGSQTYRIDKKYNRITGTVFLCIDERDTGYSGYIEILGDGVTLFKAADITSGFEPVSFDLDISYVTDLEVRIFDPDFYGASGGRCLSDVLLYPN